MIQKRRIKCGKRIGALVLAGILAAAPLEVAAETWGANETADEEFSSNVSLEASSEDLSENFISEDGFASEDTLKNEEAEENNKAADPQAELIAESYDSGEVLSGAIASDGEDSGIALFSLDYYTDSYGAQLDENAKALYDLLVQNYVVNYSEFMDSVNFTFEFPEKITFEAVVEDGAIQKTGESYESATEQVRMAVQSATDAFSYDYPQAFWFRGCSYGYSIGAVRDNNSSTKYTGTFKAYRFDPSSREIDTDAHKQMKAFMSSVNSTVELLQAQTKGMNQYDKLKTIHDYICKKVSYVNTGDLWCHTAASIFLDSDPGYVCEGYAKTFKILCYYMGINCACVSGTAKSTSSGTPGAHMWNYVQMDDSKWYMVDATWDDSGSSPSSRYFLVGKQSKGYYITIEKERVEHNSFSTVASGKQSPVFILPLLEEISYLAGQVKPTATPTATVTPTATPTPTVTPTATATPTPTATPTIEPTATPTVAPTVTPTAVPAVIPTITPTVAPTPISLPLRRGQSYKVKGKIKAVKTSNKNIATVSKKGTIKGKKAGTATITITFTNKTQKLFKVKVQKGIVKTTALTLSKKSVVLAKKGKTYKLKAVVAPVTSQQKVTYRSSKPSVVSVNAKGKIKAKKKGTAVITVTSGSKKVTCKVTVKK